MKMMSPPTVWTFMTIAIAGAIASSAAQARSAFDGGWSVQIITQRGACDPSSGFGVEIRDGVIYGSGGIPVRGRVAGNGAVSVSVSSGERRADGRIRAAAPGTASVPRAPAPAGGRQAVSSAGKRPRGPERNLDAAQP